MAYCYFDYEAQGPNRHASVYRAEDGSIHGAMSYISYDWQGRAKDGGTYCSAEKVEGRWFEWVEDPLKPGEYLCEEINPEWVEIFEALLEEGV